MKVRLEITYPAGCSLCVEQPGPLVRIGRDPANDLAIADKTCEVVSWQHAEIELSPQGARIRDLRSLNGTFLDEHRVDGEALFQVGQLIRLGHTGPVLKVMALDLGAESKLGLVPPFDHAATAVGSIAGRFGSQRTLLSPSSTLVDINAVAAPPTRRVSFSWRSLLGWLWRRA
jgi:hypothetical protein